MPREFYEQGVRRYGFHGLSYEYVISRLQEIAPQAEKGCVVVMHLGNGASMGFTALDGLPMGTRCGQLDPGVVLYLLQEKRMSAAAVTDLLCNHSGLKGL
ncbi:acetate kinase [Bradyrhizobium sp. USDA 4369]